MSIPLPVFDLSGFAVNQRGSIPLKNVGPDANPAYTQKKPHLEIFNDSGVGLLLSFNPPQTSFFLPAGGWKVCDIVPGTSEVAFTAIYTLINPPVSKLMVTYYAPSESIPTVPTLGNSPIGVSGLVSVATSQAIDNEGNVASTEWLKVIQAGGGASNFSGLVDGNFQIKQWDGAALKNLLHVIPNAGAGNSNIDFLAAGLFARVIGQLILSNAQPLMADDSGGNKQNILQVNAFNQLQLFGVSGADIIQCLDHSGNIGLVIDLVNKSLDIRTTDATINGTTAGTAELLEFFTGSKLKAWLLYFNGYQNNSATEQRITLPVAFTAKCLIWTGNTKPITSWNGGSINTNGARVATSIGAGGFGMTIQNAVSASSYGEFTGAFDQIGLGTNQVGPSTEIAIGIGF